VKQVSGQDFIRLLQRRGWILQRINGSHRVFAKEGQPERIVIPVH
jgi:predicted RNA binding protein YcfA (HicA-like mRNA interferase family)